MAGAPFLRYWVIYMERRFDVEAGVPIGGPLDGEGDVTVGSVRPAATTPTPPRGPRRTHRGTTRPAGLGEEQGLTWDADDDPEGTARGWRLEVFLTNPME